MVTHYSIFIRSDASMILILSVPYPLTTLLDFNSASILINRFLFFFLGSTDSLHGEIPDITLLLCPS